MRRARGFTAVNMMCRGTCWTRATVSCSMMGESLMEYDDWYDYSTSYPEGEGPSDADSEFGPAGSG